MDNDDDIIDVLYRYRQSPAPPSAGVTRSGPQRRTGSSSSVYTITPGSSSGTVVRDRVYASPGPNQTQCGPNNSQYGPSLSCHTSPRDIGGAATPPHRRPTRSYASTPVISSVVTGRVGYNNTPVVTRRDKEDSDQYKQQQYPQYNRGYLSRSASAYDYYHRHDQESVYMSRSRMVDLIHSDDEIISSRYDDDNNHVIQLPSGARQKVPKFIHNTSDNRAAMTGSDLRRRRAPVNKNNVPNGDVSKDSHNSDSSFNNSNLNNSVSDILMAINTIVGYLVMIVLSYQFSHYLYQLHENDLWFSEIMEVEREISFRTEQGLYYSYYKQLVHSPSLSEGFVQLQVDNKTESGHSINILERFNIYQEVVLAAIYKIYDFRLKPIFFYTYSVFLLQGVYLSCLYLMSWSLTGSWVTGVLTAISVCLNRFDVTRVQFTVPLREHFSLPFIFLKFYLVGRYVCLPASSPTNYLHMLAIYISGVIFTICWQFSQFVLLIESLVIFVLATVGLLDRERVCRVLSVTFLVMLTVWYLQFYQTMIITSLVVSLVPVTILSLQSQSDLSSPVGLCSNIGVATLRIIVAFSITLCLNIILKIWMNQTADNHIFKFVKNKFTQDSTDFETQLYLCNEAFSWLDIGTYKRLASSFALPLYGVYTFIVVTSFIIITIIRWSKTITTTSSDTSSKTAVLTRSDSKAKIYRSSPGGEGGVTEASTGSWFLDQLSSRPDLCYHVALSVSLGLLAASTLRMKCFWCPYICVLASAGLADKTFWSYLVSKLSGGYNRGTVNLVRHIAVICLIVVLFNKHKPVYEQEMSDLREFYDPDTVDLMQWLQQNTDKDAVISGSMQLMAGVKLCSDRTVTNHPHFEDLDLRMRTKELYQMYAKTSPSQVYDLLVKYRANFIILEDSICLAHRERCGLPDIMDLTNGHIPDDGVQNPSHLVRSEYPRFCEEVRYDNAEYRKYFKKVFENKTFRIYEVL